MTCITWIITSIITNAHRRSMKDAKTLIIKQNKIKYLYWGYLKKQLTYYAYNLGCTCISVPDIIDPHFWEYYHRWSQSFSLFYIYHNSYTIKYTREEWKLKKKKIANSRFRLPHINFSRMLNLALLGFNISVKDHSF